MESEGSLPLSQMPATCPFPEPDQPSQCPPPIPLPEDPSYYYPFIYAWIFQVAPFLQFSSPKPCIHLSSLHATFPAHLFLLDLITWTIFGEEYRSLNSSLCSFLHSLVTSSHLGPNIPLSTLFSNTLSLRSSLSESTQFSHPYKTTGKIVVL